MYLDLLAALEGSWLGHAGRHSAWLYTTANLLHVLGAAFVVGGIAVFDLKVLAEHGKHAWQVGRYAVPLAGAGLALQIPHRNHPFISSSPSSLSGSSMSRCSMPASARRYGPALFRLKHAFMRSFHL
jgi:hypothetical protein